MTLKEICPNLNHNERSTLGSFIRERGVEPTGIKVTEDGCYVHTYPEEKHNTIRELAANKDNLLPKKQKAVIEQKKEKPKRRKRVRLTQQAAFTSEECRY